MLFVALDLLSPGLEAESSKAIQRSSNRLVASSKRPDGFWSKAKEMNGDFDGCWSVSRKKLESLGVWAGRYDLVTFQKLSAREERKGQFHGVIVPVACDLKRLPFCVRALTLSEWMRSWLGRRLSNPIHIFQIGRQLAEGEQGGLDPCGLSSAEDQRATIESRLDGLLTDPKRALAMLEHEVW